MNVTIIADASFCPEEHVGGYGYWIASHRGKLGGGGKIANGGHVVTSTSAEMMAIANAMWHAVDNNLVQRADSVLIQTDCMAAIQAFQMTRLHLVDQERAVVKYVQGLQQHLGLEIRYRHVKGHTSIDDARSITNRMCDKRAKEAMRIARTQSKAQKLKQYVLKGPGL